MDTFSLDGGRTRALIAPEAGGRIVQIEVREHRGWVPLLVAPDDLRALSDEPLLWGCYPMAPWPGRVHQARFTWRGTEYELPANDGPHSIHGRSVYWAWAVRHRDATRCVLELDLGPHLGWPFPTRLLHEIHVEDNGVSLSLSVQNVGPLPFPAGLGWHPWFRRDVRPGVGPRVTVHASGRYESNMELIPTGEVHQPVGDADLSSGPAIQGRPLDDVYAGVRQPMEVRWGDLVLTMASSANCRHAVVYTATERGFCVEPQTCAPDAFNLAARSVEDTGVSVVAPGEAMSAATEWRWRTV